MKKSVKKVVSTVVASTMVMSMIGCSKIGKSSKDSDDAEAQVEDVVSTYMDNVIKGKSEKAMKVVDGKDDPYADAMESMTPLEVQVLEATLGATEYEVSKISVDTDEEEATAKLTISVPACYDSVYTIDEMLDEAETEDIKITVELVMDDEDFLISEDSSNEIAEAIIGIAIDENAESIKNTTAVTPIDETEAVSTGATEAVPSSTTEPVLTIAPAETFQIEVVVGDYKQETVNRDVINTDDRDGHLIIFGFNDEFQGLVDRYSIGYDDFQITPNDGQAYTTLLDTVLSDGEGAPDLFVCDADYVKKYIDDGRGNIRSKSLNSLGISYDELKEMYNYTLKFAADSDNVIRGLTWQACPCGVFYNRTVAQITLGVSEPEDVAPYFQDWKAFLDTAHIVASAGDYRIVSGWDDVYRSYLNSRKTGWVVDGRVNIDPAVEDFFTMALALHEDGLTWETSQWGGDWSANATNQAVLSYWGPMWLGYSLGLADPEKNETSGDWGMVPAPTTWYWGGTWIMASQYSDKDADVAQIMRDIAINADTLEAMNLKSGEFVNNIAYMTKIADSKDGCQAWLGGQNPFGVLLETAKTIDNSMIGIDDAKINEFFTATVSSYVNGGLDTPAEAENEFISAVQAAGLAE